MRGSLLLSSGVRGTVDTTGRKPWTRDLLGTAIDISDPHLKLNWSIPFDRSSFNNTILDK